MTLDFSRCRLPPFKHQAQDVAWLLERPYALVASEMRTGKTKIVIDAAQFLFVQGKIDRVIVVAPAPVRDVWADRTLGELAKHMWKGLPATVIEYHSRVRTWHWEHAGGGGTGEKLRTLDWLVTNYEFLRADRRLEQTLEICDERTLLVLDESAYVKNWKAQQTEACKQLRALCGRIWMLNGTPIVHSPLDLFSQGNLLHPSILDCRYVTHYKARYALEDVVRGAGGKALTNPRGNAIKRIAGWTNLEDLQRRFAPIAVRRLQRDCLDLPPKLDPVTITAQLAPKTWKAYKDMRDEMVAWLSDEVVVSPATAAQKVMRLAQITSGVLGGAEDANVDAVDEESLGIAPEDYHAVERRGFHADQEFAEDRRHSPGEVGRQAAEDDRPTGTNERLAERTDRKDPVEVGREKLDACLWFMRQQLEQNPTAKVAFFCRFVPEARRLQQAFIENFGVEMLVGLIVGGQPKADRLQALALVHPDTAPKDAPAAVVCTYGTASFGMNFSACSACVAVSSQYSAGLHAQSMDRAYGPQMQGPLALFDVVAVGPKGQHTIDHKVIEARRAGEDVASWTASAWVKALREE